MKKVTAIGELLIDFVPKEKGCALKEVTEFRRVAGGAPANVVTAVSKLGGRGVMISQVGEDAFGTHICDVLHSNGVDTSYVFRTNKANTGLAFVSLDATGNREFSFFRNPSADLFLSPEQISILSSLSSTRSTWTPAIFPSSSSCSTGLSCSL